MTSVTGLVATGTIFPGEQLIADRFGNAGSAQTLVIPDDKFAMSVELTDPERVAGFGSSDLRHGQRPSSLHPDPAAQGDGHRRWPDHDYLAYHHR